MCMYCLTPTCPVGCPNYEGPDPEYVCDECREGIYPEDEFADIDGKRYHLDCLSDMGTKKLLKLLDVDVRTA